MVEMAPSVLPPPEPPVVPMPEAVETALDAANTPGTLLPVMPDPASQQEQDQANDDKNDLDAFLEELDMTNIMENPAGLGPDHGANTMSLLERLEDELKCYHATPAMSIFINATIKDYRDPLTWWKDNQAHFPIMSEVAQILLCIQATSTPLERIFSLASRVISKLRSSLNPDNASQIVFVNGALEWFE
jgi:hypothetical protein